MWTRGILPFFLFLLLNSRPATAQAPPLDCQQDAACLQLSQSATERYKAGDLVEAQRLYKRAYEVRPDPRLLYNIARALHKHGQTGEAAPYYQRFLDSEIQDEQQRQKAREYLNQVSSELPAATPTSPPTEASAAKKPVYKKWWFWTLLGGGVAAGVAIGVGVGLTVNHPQKPELPGDVTYYSFTF